jgi:hypothetical protein
MIFWFRKFFAKPYKPCMELHNQLGCYFTIQHPSTGPIEGYNQFFYENNFLIVSHIKPEQDINQIISSVYSFNIDDLNLVKIKGERKVYFSNNSYISLSEDSIFAYDKSKFKIFY